MPVISTIGAASARGFGEFNQQDSGNYVEDCFATFTYTGNGSIQAIDNNIAFKATGEWSGYKFFSFGADTQGYGITVDSFGNFYITGTTIGNSIGFIAKYNSSGVLQWQKTFSQSSSGVGRGVAANSSGDVFVVGTASDGVQYIFIAKYNSSGVLQWQKKLENVNSCNGYRITLDGSSNVYIAGSVTDSFRSYAVLAKYDSSGSLQWQRQIYEQNSIATGIAVDVSGNVYISFDANVAIPSNIFYIGVAKYNSSGVIQWQRKIYQGAFSSSGGIAVDSSGNAYVTGYVLDTTATLITAKYNSSGTLQWQRKLQQSSIIGYGITVDNSGNIYVVGNNSNSIYVAKYNSTPALQWQVNLKQGTSVGQDIATDGSGNVYVIGYANDGNEYSIAVKLKADGTCVSGSAFVSLAPATATEGAASATEQAGTALSITGSSTDSVGGATDAIGSIISTISTQPATFAGNGLVWIKTRNGTNPNVFYDTLRGATKELETSSIAGESTRINGITEFTASGFSVGSWSYVNANASIYGSWTFKSFRGFFDTITYTGNGVAGRAINHSLGSVPGMIIVKRTDTNGAWAVYHKGLSNTEYMLLNTSAAAAANSSYWNNTTPTNTQFTVGTSADVNANGGTYVAYLFASGVAGFGVSGLESVIDCGTYSGNGSATGPIINLGWEPQWILIKRATGGTGNWNVIDNLRGLTVDGNDWKISTNINDAESSIAAVDPNATGFQLTTTNIDYNAAGSTYIYVAVRRGPMSLPTNGLSVFFPTVYTPTNTDNKLITTQVYTDMVFVRDRTDTVLGGMVVGDRMRGQPYFLTGTAAAQVTSATAFDQQIVSGVEYGTAFTSQNGFWAGSDSTAKINSGFASNDQIVEAFARAPRFFDISAYSGTGVAKEVNHNLTIPPELILVKSRTNSTAWGVYASNQFAPEKKYLTLNTNAAADISSTYWNDTLPTSTQFTVGTSTSVNGSGNKYISYLFGTCAGVSKVGSYFGTGSTQQVNCGFSSGARLVLIKRIDSTGDWYIYDSARGIIAGNDPYILLNSTDAEVTNTDYVDVFASGFELSNTAPSGLNEAPGITWVSRSSGFTSSNVNSVAYGDGVFVAVGADGKISTSDDGGFTWTSRTSGFGASAINAVTYGNGLFVCAGADGKLATSTDGITWTLQTSGFGSTNINELTYGNSLFVAVGDSGTLTTSPDGINWTSRTSQFSAQAIYGVVYGDGKYVAVGQNGTIATSSNAITWTIETSGTVDALNTVTFGNNLFVAGGASGTLITSPNGSTWTSRTSGFSANEINGSIYSNGTYIIVGQLGNISSSSNGTSWTSRTSGTVNNLLGIGGGNNYVFAVGETATMLSNSPTYIYLAIA